MYIIYGFCSSLSLSLSFSLPPRLPPAQLLKEAQSYAQVTPMQVSYLFELCSMEEKTAGSVSLRDFERLLPRPTLFSQRVGSTASTQPSQVCTLCMLLWYEILEFSLSLIPTLLFSFSPPRLKRSMVITSKNLAPKLSRLTLCRISMHAQSTPFTCTMYSVWI